MDQSRTFQWLVVVEAAGVGTWGRTFQVWVGWFSWGTYGGANGVSTVQTYKSVSELTTRPRLGEDCWSRGLQSALLLLLLRWGISHRWRLPGLMESESLGQPPQTIRLYAHCLGASAGTAWRSVAAIRADRIAPIRMQSGTQPDCCGSGLELCSALPGAQKCCAAG